MSSRMRVGGIAPVDAGDALATVTAATLGPAGYVTRNALDEIAPETRKYPRQNGKPRRCSNPLAKDVGYDSDRDVDTDVHDACAICLSALSRRTRRRQLPCSHLYHSDVSAFLGYTWSEPGLPCWHLYTYIYCILDVYSFCD